MSPCFNFQFGNFLCYLKLVFSQTSDMAPANQPISMVSTIDARMTPSGSGSVAPGSVQILI